MYVTVMFSCGGCYVAGCTLSVVGVVQSARCDAQSQVFHPGKLDASLQPQQPQQGQCAADGIYGRLASSTALAGACPQQYRAASVSSVLSAAFRASSAATPANTAGLTASVTESPFYFQDGGAGYRTTPVAGAPMTSYNYEKCAI